MTSPLSSQNPSADERAAYWAARLDGSVLSAREQVALDEWLAKSPAHRTLLSHYCQFSADLELLLPELAARGTIELPSEIAPRRPLWTNKWVIGAATAAAALIAVALWPARARSQLDNVATAAAQRQTLTLVDGSKAELNAQTNLKIEIGAGERRVRLASGEAFFTVAKDSARPFIVETPAGSVRVTGTVFNVRAETSSALEVLVVEGSVQVRPGDTTTARAVAPVMLHPGQELSAGADGVAVRMLSAGAMDNLLAWRHGLAVFNDELLSTALARFARYHGRGITAAPEVANLRIGGRFSLDDLDGFLNALEAVLPVRVTRALSGTVRVEGASPAAAATAATADREKK